jgi:hypothetical protein
MKRLLTPLVTLSLLALGGCGSKTSDSLQDAAEQSTPEAAQVLNDRAAALDGDEGNGSLSAAGSPAQQAMEAAGDAQGGAANAAPNP